mmetsp:Transcript_1206/g.2063  ORF Transcript_1206/g.2063 Transcript_1206/m.2063 type:complete len:200 (+) Transcript_1206:830-1429(+)
MAGLSLGTENIFPIKVEISIQIVPTVIFNFHDELGSTSFPVKLCKVHHLAILCKVDARFTSLLKGITINVHNNRDTRAAVKVSTGEAVGVCPEGEPKNGTIASVGRREAHQRAKSEVILQQTQSIADFVGCKYVTSAICFVLVHENHVVLFISIAAVFESLRLELQDHGTGRGCKQRDEAESKNGRLHFGEDLLLDGWE